MFENPTTAPRASRRGHSVLVAGVFAMVLLVAACGSSSTKSGTGPSTSSNPGTMFSVANVPGLGMVVVDGRGRTVYNLTSGGHRNVPCDASNGCTTVWPDLPLPDGTSGAKAGSGINASLLGTMKVGSETYPTYNGWLMYEYTGDSGPGQAHGQGIQSFGGTWYALNAAGEPITMTGSSSPSTTSGGSSGY